MRRSRKKQYIILITIIALIFSLSVAYAVLSSTLSITGSAEVINSTWDFTLKSGSTSAFNIFSTTGSATAEIPTISGTSLSYNISLLKPGDSVSYYLNILNNGTLPGEIDSVIHSTPKCTSATGNQTDEALICNNLIYTLKYYLDNKEVQSGNIIDPNNYICEKNNQSGVYSKTLVLTVTLNPNLTTVPSSKITISNLKTDINIIQTESNCSEIASPGEK